MSVCKSERKRRPSACPKGTAKLAGRLFLLLLPLIIRIPLLSPHILRSSLRLRGEDSKNGQPRTVTLSGELWEIIQRRWKARRFRGENGEWVLSSLVFFRTRGRGVPEAGAPVKEFRKSWKAACEAAGLQGRLFYDFRRTAARNMRRVGVPEEIAMKITGHKTTSMFRRYNITDDRDITEALAKTQLYVRSLPKKRTVLPFQKSSKEEAK